MEPTTFAELSLSAKVLEAITASGYTTPTPIQAQAIPVAMTGRDVLGIAQTGTGKTAAFVMPMISRLETGRARARMPRSLILAPTRELAAQVAASFEKYGQNHKLAVALLIGGGGMDEQIKKLDRGVDVLIATPGRLIDHFTRGRIMLMGVEILVIDEADRMLDMGFIPDIEKICKLLPPRRQTLFFSATMPPEITRLVDQFLTNPQRIEVAKPATTAKTITQRFVYCPDGEDYTKRDILRELIRSQPVKNAIIFCNRKRDVAILYKSMVKHGFNAGELHGDMDQSSRTATLDKFRAGEITILAASDVAARGLDIPEVSHVFNFDVPWQADDYVHRIGRTGRAGREGFSASLVSMDDFKALKEIEKITGEDAIWLGDAPTAEDMAEGATRKRGRGRGKPPARGGDRRDGSRGDARQARGNDARPPRGPRPERAPRPEVAGEQPVVLAGEAGVPIEAPQGEAVSNRERSRNRRSRGGERGPKPPRDGAAAQGANQPRAPRQQQDQPVVPDYPGQGEQPSLAALNEQPREARPPREPRERQQQQPRAERQDGRQNGRGDNRGEGRGEPRRQEARQDARNDRGPRDEQPRQEREQRQPREDRNPRPNRADAPFNPHDKKVRHREDNGPRVGFEDNIPAFLRRPAAAKG